MQECNWGWGWGDYPFLDSKAIEEEEGEDVGGGGSGAEEKCFGEFSVQSAVMFLISFRFHDMILTDGSAKKGSRRELGALC